MARTFTKNLSNFMSCGPGTLGAILNGAAQISAHCWIKAASFTGNANDNRALSIVIGAGSSGIGLGVHNGSNAVVHCGARSQSADGYQTKSGTTVLSTGVWHSIGAVYNIAGDTITPYAKGVAEGGGSVTFGAATYTHTRSAGLDSVGAYIATTAPGATELQLNGQIAEMAIWKALLTAGEFAALATGVSPFEIAGGPAIWLPLWGDDSPEQELIANAVGTITGTVAKADHAPVIPFTRSLWGSYPDVSVAGGGGAKPWNYYQQMRRAG